MGWRRLALLCAAALGHAAAMLLDVQPGDTRCLGEELGEQTPARFVFKQAKAKPQLELPANGMVVQVTRPAGASIFREVLHGDEPKVFQYTSTGPGLYHICFTNHGDAVQRVDVDVGRLFDPETFVKSIKAEALQPLELLLSRAEDAARAINAEMDLMIQREAVLKTTSINMEWRINAFAMFSIAVLLGLSAWQMVFLKRFFRSKKLL